MGFFDQGKAQKAEDEVETGTPAVDTADDTEADGEGEGKSSGKRAVRNAALEKIIKYLQDNEAPEDIIEAAKVVRPSYFGIVGGGNGGFQKQEFTADQKRLAELVGKDSYDEVAVGDKFDEMTAFQKLRFGRKDINGLIKHLIKNPGEKTRAWLEYDVDTGITEVVAISDETPADWKGYLPTSAASDEA